MIGQKMAEMKVATARALIIIATAERPMSYGSIKEGIADQYEKLYDDDTLKSSLDHLQLSCLINEEFFITQRGQTQYKQLAKHKAGRAEKYFRKSDSPNVGPRAPTPKLKSAIQKQHAHPANAALTA